MKLSVCTKVTDSHPARNANSHANSNHAKRASMLTLHPPHDCFPSISDSHLTPPDHLLLPFLLPPLPRLLSPLPQQLQPLLILLPQSLPLRPLLRPQSPVCLAFPELFDRDRTFANKMFIGPAFMARPAVEAGVSVLRLAEFV